MSVLTLQQFRDAYQKQNPHDVVPEPQEIKRNWATIVPLFVGLIAANILSAFHTGPLIALAFKTFAYTNEYNLMFIVGVLAVEFTVFVTMFVPWDKTTSRDRALRILVIVLAIAVSGIANVSATITNLGGTDGASTIAGGLVGIFAPLANLAIAEVLRTILNRTKQERDLAYVDYNSELRRSDVLMRNRYVNYLKRIGITDPTEVMKLSSGELPPEPKEVEFVPAPEPTVRYLELPKQKQTSTKAELLADQLVMEGNTGLSFKTIEKQYNTNPATVNAAKKILRQRGLIE